MKITKILSFVAGLSLLAATLIPVKVSAASASLSLTGTTNTNGAFSAVVYENSGSARVTTAKIDLSFSSAVSNVSYDYSVGPFSNPTPSGAGAAQGYVTGLQPVARVSFKLANPGTVTTSAGNSFLKGTNDEGTQVITHSISGGSAAFTYDAPAPVTPGRGSDTPSNPASTSTTGTAKTTKSTGTTTVATNGAVAGDETTTAAEVPATTNTKEDTAKKSDTKKDDSKDDKNSSSAWFWIFALVAVVAGVLAGRKYAALKKAPAQKAAPVAASKPAAKKNVKKTPKKTSRS